MFAREDHFIALLICTTLILTSSLAVASGKISLDGASLLKKPPTPVEQNQFSLSLDFKTKGKWSEEWRWRFEPWTRAQSAKKISEKNPEWNSRDSFLEFKNSEMTFQLGSFVKSWEGTDGLNPMDLVTMKNMTSPLHSESLGSWGLWGQKTWGLATFEALWIPDQIRTSLPGERAGWWPRETQLPLEKDNSQLLLPENPEYEILDRQDRHKAYQHNYGGRLRFQFEKWDFSLAHFNGATQTPTISPLLRGDLVEAAPRLVVRLSNPIQIQPIDDRRKSWALGLNLQLEEMIFRFAGRTDEPTDSENTVVAKTWQTVTGFEKTISLYSSTWIVVAQYAYGKSSEQEQTAMSTQGIFSNSFLFGTKASLTDETSLQISLVNASTARSLISSLDLESRWSDHLSTRLGFDSLSGPADSLVGVWKNQSQIRYGIDWQL